MNDIMENFTTFQKILIAVDDSKYSYNAAKYGFGLAKKLGAEVGLIHVNEFPVTANIAADPLLGDPGISIPNILDIQKESAVNLVNKIKEEFAEDLAVSEFILEGNITDEVINTAKSFNASLIVLGTHSRTGLSHFIAGSVAENISRHSVCPVLIVPTKS
ncbi:universal stress protein [Pedobacter puniceum]|jgi:nucleotide-binding universal stress UspA family protein|nr:universal stress protein [Pedobacter puniceum]